MYNEEYISSRNNPVVKFAASLLSKKGRDEEKSFIAEGEKLTYEAIEAGLPITHIFISDECTEKTILLIKEKISKSQLKNVRIIMLASTAFEKISTEKAPQGVISVIKHLDFFSIIDIIYKKDFFLSKDERTIVLCSVRDPLNLGSVIRSSVAFGIDRIILSADCADVYNPKTVRASMGSLFRVKISRVLSLPDFIDAAKHNGRRVFAAELSEKARSLKEIDIKSSDIVMIGNEGHGIPKEISSLCSESVYIPISKKTESLNAAVAAAIFMWEQNK